MTYICLNKIEVKARAKFFRFSECENYSLKCALHEYMHYVYYTKRSIFISIVFQIYSTNSLFYIR